jgi:hypothetical protein
MVNRGLAPADCALQQSEALQLIFSREPKVQRETTRGLMREHQPPLA